MNVLYARTIITGAGGMLAGALDAALKVRGVEAVLLDRAALDITDAESIKQALQRYRPTLLFNCAAYTKVDLAEAEKEKAFAVNSARVFTSLCREHVRRFVHFSTDFVFDGTASAPYRPEHPTHPLSVYGQSKLAGEEMVRQHLDDHLIIRTAWLYGPGGPCFPRTIVNAVRAGKPLNVVSDQQGCPTLTHDLAQAALNLIDVEASSGTYHVANAGQTTWFEFARSIIEEFGLKADVSPTTAADWKRLHPNSAIRPAYSVLDTSRYTQATGQQMRPWRNAVRAFRQEIDARGGF
jgi:dTDP-4-dehydrorhamnose reductase